MHFLIKIQFKMRLIFLSNTTKIYNFLDNIYYICGHTLFILYFGA